MRTTQEIFTFFIDANLYQEGSFMCNVAIRALERDIITVEEYDFIIGEINSFVQTICFYPSDPNHVGSLIVGLSYYIKEALAREFVTIDSGVVIPIIKPYPMIIYKNWDKRFEIIKEACMLAYKTFRK